MNLSNILKRHEMWLKGEKDGESACLRNADLRGANFKKINLKNANLEGANLFGADLRDANLEGANLFGANLRDANLEDTNLFGANLRGANLENIQTNIHTIGYNLACPEKGSFVAYKRAGGYIVKLLVLEDAKRNSATSYKCRCNAAKVLDIENIRTGLKVAEVNVHVQGVNTETLTEEPEEENEIQEDNSNQENM